jgi:hypothetical protein
MIIIVKLTIILLILLILLITVCYNLYTNEKYFHEPSEDPHYDIRYYKYSLSLPKKQDILREMFGKLSKFLNANNVKCSLSYGTLLGYYRHRDIIPWDDDIDVSMFWLDLEKLPHREMISNRYLWDRNIKATPGLHDNNNKVIARLICIETGVFIDVFAQYQKDDKIISSDGDILNKKDILPFRTVTFLDITSYIPNNTKQVLLDLYKDISIPRDKLPWKI